LQERQDKVICDGYDDILQNMPQIKDVIFLGAGASQSENAPGQNKLFEEFFKLEENDFEWDEKEKYKNIRGNLALFFKYFFGIDIESKDLFPTFEEALGILELSISKQEAFKKIETIHKDLEIQQIREDLIFAMAIVIERKLKNKGDKHRNLVNTLKKCRCEFLKTAFISLNYDILIDNALTEINSEYDLDYGIEFTNFNKSENGRVRSCPSRSIHLYKPHGSLNWLYCPTCKSITLTPKVKGVVTLIFNPIPCKKCHTEMIPIIIPPTFFKDMSNRYLEEIWYKTENALKQAENIYFFGYSFPDADIYIKYLLKRAEVNGKSDLKIFVINRSIGKELKERYKRFFKGEIRFKRQTFQKFCDDLPIKCENYLKIKNCFK
jgi:NAD-dependent SIR2 family protein deacetylase